RASNPGTPTRQDLKSCAFDQAWLWGLRLGRYPRGLVMWGADPWTRPRIDGGVRKLFWCLKLLRVDNLKGEMECDGRGKKNA
ncbi:MAG: hypothetical protein ACFFDU_07525, partial [Candidatus Thorarchaeota archaeon]